MNYTVSHANSMCSVMFIIFFKHAFSVNSVSFLQNILWSRARTPACLILAGEMATVLVLETLCLFPVIWDTGWREHQSSSAWEAGDECGALLYRDVLVRNNATAAIGLIICYGSDFVSLKSY